MMTHRRGGRRRLGTLLLSLLAAMGLVGAVAGDDEPPRDSRRSRVVVRFPEEPIKITMRRGAWGHHFVRPQIEGQTLGWFAVDTGTARSFIGRTLAQRLRLKRIGTSMGKGIGGRTHKPLVRVEHFLLGGLDVTSLPMGALDLQRLNLGLGTPPAGVLGMDVLSRCVVVYDQVRSRMTLHDPATYALPYGAWRPLSSPNDKPAVEMVVEGHAGVFEIDSGNPGGMIISPAAVARWRLLHDRKTRPATIGGLGGGVGTQRGLLSWVEWGGKRFNNIAADFVTDDHGAAADDATDGLIGTDLLTRYILVIDMTHKRIAYLDRR